MSVSEYFSQTEKEEQIKELTDVIVRTECSVKLLEDRILSIGYGSDIQCNNLLPVVLADYVSSMIECGTAERAECSSTRGMPSTSRNPLFSLMRDTDIAPVATDVDIKSNKCVRKSKGLEKGVLRVIKSTSRHPSFPRSSLSSAEPRERKRTKLIKGEGIGNGSRVGKEGDEGGRLREIGIGIGVTGGEWETGGEDDMSQLKQEERVHEAMSSRDSEGEMHSMDSRFESALNSQKSFADSDTDGTLLSASICIARSALSSNARLSDNNENERGSLADSAEFEKSGTLDLQQSRRVLGEMRKEVRSALRSRVKAVGLTAKDAVERFSSHRATSSTQDSKRPGCVTSPVDCSIQASGAMSKLLSALFEDLNEGRKGLRERAAKRDIEVTQSILDDISRLNCGRGRDKAEVRLLFGSRSPSKVSPSAEELLEYDLEYYTGDRSGGRSGAGTETEEERQLSSCLSAIIPVSDIPRK
jgi:hypothetical protein